jgi:tetratricopeptide (TPR) repeat protein
VLFFWLAAATLAARQSPPANAQQTATPAAQQAPQAQEVPDESTLPEDDETRAPRKYVLNPLESERNVKVGNYYWHKGKYRAALERYEDATRFNPSSAEAFYKVGEAEEKLKNADAARLAFQKVIDLAPDSKLAHDAKKKLESKI